MSTSINTAFIQQWSDEVKQAFQQKGSKLLDVTRVARNVTGSTYNFHKLDAVVANTKTREGNVTPLNPAHTIVTATLADYYAPVYVDKLDELKTNIDARKEYVQVTANALGRKVDDVIIAAAAAATTTTTTTTGGLTFAKLQEIITYFNASDVDPEDRILVVGAKQLTEALGITQLTSTDYVQMQAIMNAGIGSALGMKWILSTRLPLATVNRTCFAFNKQALGVAVGQDVTTEVNYVPEKVATLINSYASLGAVVIENAGIVKMNCVE